MATENKVKQINGFNYSMSSYPEYKFRAKMEYQGFVLPHNVQSLDIYTDNPSRNEVEKLFIEKLLKKYDDLNSAKTKIIFWTTKKQDDITSEFINETLKGI